ncbi:MAG: MTH938/NDUFAF3 family protein [Hydrogenophilus sp.]|nr:MTH938/NDUFAF3 family protein [Hydrogenophilus sp.]
MKLEASLTPNALLITRYDEAAVTIGTTRVATPLLLTPHGWSHPWGDAAWSDLTPEQLDPLYTSSPELILIGTGPSSLYPPRPLLARLIARGVGFEIMSLPAACRTYNIVASEGRAVVAALFFRG